jgi:flagellar hook-associated protein 2
MSTSGINSLLSSLGSSSTESLSELLGESTNANTNAGDTSALQDAVNAILNSATTTSGSGIDVQSTVDAILQIDAAPEIQLQGQVTTLNAQTAALQQIESNLAALQTSVQALSDPTGAFGALAVTSSNNDVVSATAANGTTAGTHTITVSSLATTAASYSSPLTSGSTVIPTGTLDIQVGGTNSPVEPIPVDSTDNTTTLSGLATYIKNQDIGVTASVITDASGARLSLVSQTSGAGGAFTVTDPTGTTGLTFSQAVDASNNPLGADASLTVDGVPVTSGSNTVTGVIPGVTLTLSGESTSPVTLAIQPDLTQVGTAINNFVSAYNTVMGDINAQYADNGASGSTVPPLLGDPSLDLLQQQLLSGITTSISGNSGLVNLQSIGIQVQEDGTLTVQSTSSPDSMDLNDALANHFAAVQNLFQSTSGVAQTLNTDLTALTDPTNGPLNLDMTGVAGQVTDLNTQISNFQAQLQNTQTQLMAEYSTINTTLEQLPETIASINSQINALNPQNTQ